MWRSLEEAIPHNSEPDTEKRAYFSGPKSIDGDHVVATPTAARKGEDHSDLTVCHRQML